MLEIQTFPRACSLEIDKASINLLFTGSTANDHQKRCSSKTYSGPSLVRARMADERMVRTGARHLGFLPHTVTGQSRSRTGIPSDDLQPIGLQEHTRAHYSIGSWGLTKYPGFHHMCPVTVSAALSNGHEHCIYIPRPAALLQPGRLNEVTWNQESPFSLHLEQFATSQDLPQSRTVTGQSRSKSRASHQSPGTDETTRIRTRPWSNWLDTHPGDACFRPALFSDYMTPMRRAPLNRLRSSLASS
jgi:hypothetical protein